MDHSIQSKLSWIVRQEDQRVSLLLKMPNDDEAKNAIEEMNG
jgi:hypothetical protein